MRYFRDGEPKGLGNFNEHLVDNGGFYRTQAKPNSLKDPRDGLVRAILIKKEDVLKFGSSIYSYNKKEDVELKVDHYLTSNGTLLSKNTFEKVYENASSLIIKTLKTLEMKHMNKEDKIRQPNINEIKGNTKNNFKNQQ